MRLVEPAVAAMDVAPNHVEPRCAAPVAASDARHRARAASSRSRSLSRLGDEPFTATLRLVGAVRPEYRTHFVELAAALGVSDRMELSGPNHESGSRARTCQRALDVLHR